MDIIITGEQGAGKTRAAETLLKAMRYSDSEVLFIHDMYPTPGLIREMIRAARVRCVVFDGPITKPHELVGAVKVIKDYRREINADILAVYVCPGEAVMITDGEVKVPNFSDNRFRDCPPSQQMGAAFDEDLLGNFATHEESRAYKFKKRTDAVLADVWDLTATKVDEAGADQMRKKLDELCNARVPENAPATCWGLHHLDADGKIEMHKFLLDLLRKYE